MNVATCRALSWFDADFTYLKKIIIIPILDLKRRKKVFKNKDGHILTYRVLWLIIGVQG